MEIESKQYEEWRRTSVFNPRVEFHTDWSTKDWFQKIWRRSLFLTCHGSSWRALCTRKTLNMLEVKAKREALYSVLRNTDHRKPKRIWDMRGGQKLLIIPAPFLMQPQRPCFLQRLLQSTWWSSESIINIIRWFAWLKNQTVQDLYSSGLCW